MSTQLLNAPLHAAGITNFVKVYMNVSIVSTIVVNSQQYKRFYFKNQTKFCFSYSQTKVEVSRWIHLNLKAFLFLPSVRLYEIMLTQKDLYVVWVVNFICQSSDVCIDSYCFLQISGILLGFSRDFKGFQGVSKDF